jgi:hypothetical protein
MAFNYKSWRENQRIDRAKTEMTRAQTVFNAVNELTAHRSHATLVYFRDLVEEGRTPDRPEDVTYRKTVEGAYRQAVADWNAKIQLMVKQVEFDVDFAARPHDGKDIDAIDAAYGHWKAQYLNCRRPMRSAEQPKTINPENKALAPVDWQKAFWVLAGVHICFVELSQGLTARREALLDLKTTVERRAAMKEFEEKLDNIRQHAGTFTHVASRSLRHARGETQARTFWEYILDW